MTKNATNLDISTLDIAESFAKGLISGIGGQIGAAIFSSIFGGGKESMPSYFTEVFDRIQTIVHQEISQNSIHEIDGMVNGVKDWVLNTYLPRKNSGTVTQEELLELLQASEYDAAVHMVSILQQENFAKPGLGVFVVAAAMHLSLLQELALVDPTAETPEKSSYAKSVKAYAKEYSEFCTKTYNAIEKARLDRISKPALVRDNNGVAAWEDYSWRDTFTGQKFRNHTEINEFGMRWRPEDPDMMITRVDEEHAAYVKKTKNDLQESLGHPSQLAADWNKLKDTPIPKKEQAKKQAVVG